MNFDKNIDRRQTESLKWRRWDPDILAMWVADTDFEVPQEVMDAIHARVDHGILGYGFAPDGLTDVVTSRLARLYNWQVSNEQVQYVPGIVTGFNVAVRGFCKPGEEVIYQVPAYPPFIRAPRGAGMQGVQNAMVLGESGQYEVDFELFERQIIDNKVRVFILCNPHNPTGRVYRRDELEKFAEICLRHDVIIVSDEIHCDILYDDRKHIPIAGLSKEISDVTITLQAPSKTYNIAGLHTSVAIIQNEELRQRYNASKAGLVGTPCILGMYAAKAAYEHGDAWLQAQLAYLQANRDLIDEALQTDLKPIKWAKPEATFLAWLDCRDLGVEGSMQEFFLDRAKVGFNDGPEFGEVGQGFVRLNFGTTRANIQLAIEKMKAAIESL
ncbi:MAG TPA: MalY/PatB family protein [Anaerolineaceae bacterium]|nr:pyridoxal phosphate-dependent aminotransferase [Anaerolineaceae bacterium]HNZ14483.1 MalY/PatB family protein [Anaerolineaceae bacterium]HQL91843.1 MalY/PatB family protein [Anaerolineaceae bacterium]